MIGETVRARGHRNVVATHRTTFELTCEPEISGAADCIIAVCADRSAATLSEAFKAAAARDDAHITAVIKSGGHSDTVRGWGSGKMTFSDRCSMVFRVSDFVCGRTVMVDADKPAARLDRGLIAALSAGNEVVVELSVRPSRRPEPSFNTLFEE